MNITIIYITNGLTGSQSVHSSADPPLLELKRSTEAHLLIVPHGPKNTMQINLRPPSWLPCREREGRGAGGGETAGPLFLIIADQTEFSYCNTCTVLKSVVLDIQY